MSRTVVEVERQADEHLTIFEWNETVRDHVKLDVPSIIMASRDVAQLTEMAYKLGFNGQAYVKVTNGKSYVIIKHRAGTRPQLAGTRYLASNKRVANFVLGARQSALSAARTTRVLALIYVGIHIVEEIMSDEVVLSRMFGRIGVDIAKVAASAGVGWLAGAATAAGMTLVGVATAPAVIPLIVAFAVGTIVGIALDELDKRYKLTDKVVSALATLGERASETIDDIRNLPRDIRRAAEDFVARAAGVVAAEVVDAVERRLQDEFDRIIRRYRPFQFRGR